MEFTYSIHKYFWMPTNVVCIVLSPGDIAVNTAKSFLSHSLHFKMGERHHLTNIKWAHEIASIWPQKIFKKKNIWSSLILGMSWGDNEHFSAIMVFDNIIWAMLPSEGLLPELIILSGKNSPNSIAQKSGAISQREYNCSCNDYWNNNLVLLTCYAAEFTWHVQALLLISGVSACPQSPGKPALAKPFCIPGWVWDP